MKNLLQIALSRDRDLVLEPGFGSWVGALHPSWFFHAAQLVIVKIDQTINKGKMEHGLNDTIIFNQLQQSLLDANYLCGMMAQSTLDIKVKNIVVVTHSLPHSSCISWNRYPPDLEMVGCYGNSRYQWALDADINEKCKYWVFGHNHDAKNIPYKHMKFVSNPRGRREDWNREKYQVCTIEV